VTKEATQATQDAWKGILFVHSRVVRALEADLMGYADLPLDWLDVMNRLNEHSEKRLRAHELADASLFTRSGLTRLVDRIEDAGYVRREHSKTDRRGVYIALTEAGVGKLESLWPDFATSIQNHFGRHLSHGDIKAITVAMNKVLQANTNSSGDHDISSA
jgi:DNA-binding MarR family transcriptional regulator